MLLVDLLECVSKVAYRTLWIVNLFFFYWFAKTHKFKNFSNLHVTIVISRHNVRLTFNLRRYKLRLWIAACLKEKITRTQTHLIQEYNKNHPCMCRPSNNQTLKTLCFSSLPIIPCMYVLFSWLVGFWNRDFIFGGMIFYTRDLAWVK